MGLYQRQTANILGEMEVAVDTFECECLDCGYRMPSDDHCFTLACPICGAEMRRVGHPGPGTIRESVDEWQLLGSVPVGLGESPYEGSYGVGALVNPYLDPYPDATLIKVSPLSYEPGKEIRPEVKYKPVNGESYWQTVVVAKEGTTVLTQDRNQHISKAPGEVVTVSKTGKIMPSKNVYLTIEVWAHGNYFEGGWPY